MKFLEANPRPEKEENKMRDGSRPDQLRGKTETRTAADTAKPAVKQLAEKLSVDLKTVIGTGPAGAITTDDVQKAADLKDR